MLFVVLAGDVQRGSRQRPSTDRDDRFLKAERRKQTGGVEPVRESESRPLKFRREATRVHGVETDFGRFSEPPSTLFRIGERIDIRFNQPERPSVRVLSSSHVPFRLPGVVTDVDIDPDDSTAALSQGLRDCGTIADTDFEQPIVPSEC